MLVMQMMDGWVMAAARASEQGCLGQSSARGLQEPRLSDEVDEAEEEAELAAAQAARIAMLQAQRHRLQQVSLLVCHI